MVGLGGLSHSCLNKITMAMAWILRTFQTPSPFLWRRLGIMDGSQSIQIKLSLLNVSVFDGYGEEWRNLKQACLPICRPFFMTDTELLYLEHCSFLCISCFPLAK